MHHVKPLELRPLISVYTEINSQKKSTIGATSSGPCRPGALSSSSGATLRRHAYTLNQMLAWTLVALPLTAIALHWTWRHTLPWALGLLAAHGAMSVVLWGGPKRPRDMAPGDDQMWAAWLIGQTPKGSSPREAFITAAWRVAACTLWVVVGVLTLTAANTVMASSVAGPLSVWALALLAVALSAFPFVVGIHISAATRYAMRRTMGRWGRKGWLSAALGVLLAWAYNLAQIWHLFTGW